MKNLIDRLWSEDQGQDLIEYAILTGFIALVAVVAITNIGVGVNKVFANIEAKLKTAGGS